MYFSNVKYLGGLPHPFDATGNIDIVVNHQSNQLIFRQGSSKNISFSKQEVTDVSTDIKHDRSIGKGVTGYVIGRMIASNAGGLIGAAIGARRKDVSMVYIRITWNSRQSTVVLNAGKKAWDMYAAINSFIF